MDRLDFSPLFRSTIGFDRLTRLVDAASRVDNAALAYPPYNIEKTGEDAYRLTMAVAGFASDEVEVTAHQNSLLVTGKAKKEEDESRYLHRGIARRAFERRFSLADHIKVVGASLDNGMLHVVSLSRSPRRQSRARSRSAAASPRASRRRSSTKRPRNASPSGFAQTPDAPGFPGAFSVSGSGFASGRPPSLTSVSLISSRAI